MDQKQIELTQKMIHRDEIYPDIVLLATFARCSMCQGFMEEAPLTCGNPAHKIAFDLLEKAKSLL